MNKLEYFKEKLKDIDITKIMCLDLSDQDDGSTSLYIAMISGELKHFENFKSITEAEKAADDLYDVLMEMKNEQSR